MVLRTLLAGAAVAAALAPAAQASCHMCFLPVECEAVCGPLNDFLADVESEVPASGASWGVYDTVCHVLVDNTGINMHCHD